MYQVGADVLVVDNNDLEHSGWTGIIVEIDSQATEGDCYGVRFEDSPTIFYFRAQDIALIDLEKERQAWDADMKDMQKIRQEWYDYRHEGDETPPSPPSYH